MGAVLSPAQTAAIDTQVAAAPPTQVVPTLADGTPDYTMRTRFDQRDFNLRFTWNQRDERWYMGIFAVDDTPIVLGVKIVCNVDLLRYYRYDSKVPQGALFAWDHSADSTPPNLNDMAIGARVELTYHPTVV